MDDAASLRARAAKAEFLGKALATEIHRANLLLIASDLRAQADALDAADQNQPRPPKPKT